jgi:hypothetical protein
LTVEAIVLTYNEERNIADCLRCLLWADGLTVVDQGSTDRTAALAQSLGARVISHPFESFAAQRNLALGRAWADWAFFVDADERCTPELAREIRSALGKGKAGWWVPRQNFIFGRLTRGAGWWPDYQLRLLRTGKASYDPRRPVHEVVVLDGEAGHLEHPLIHYNYHSMAQFLRKQWRYSCLEARAILAAGETAKARSLIGRPVREFWRRFVSLKGYEDGVHGFWLSILMASYSFVVQARVVTATSGRRPQLAL